MAPGDNQELMKRLLERLDDITDIKVALGTLTEQIKSMATSQEELTHAVKGNGKPGLIDRVRDLEQFQQTHPATCPAIQIAEQYKKERDERTKEVRMWKWGLAASVIMLLLNTLRDVAMTLLAAPK